MNPTEMPEITKIQLQQSVETYRVQLSLLVQISTVLAASDAAVVGYAAQQRIAAIIWAGLVLPVAMIVVIRVIFRLAIPVLATALAIETRYKNPEVIGLMSTFVAVGTSHEFLERLRAAALIEHEPARMAALSSLGRMPVFVGGAPVKWALFLIVCGQACAPLLLWQFAKWQLWGPA